MRRDGRSLVPLLRNPDTPWERAVVSTWLPNNHSVVDQRWRYIRYADGAEELYDHQNDAEEITNLAPDPKFGNVKVTLARWLPTRNAPLLKVPGKAAAKN